MRPATVLALALCAACTRQSVPAPGIPDDRAAEASFRALARALGGLGSSAGAVSEIDQRLSRSKAGFDFEARGPAEREIGDALYGGTPPRPEDLDAAFARHCRRTEPPERGRAEDGYARITLRGVEPRSGAECVLVADIRADGRWRFVLRVRRGP